MWVKEKSKIFFNHQEKGILQLKLSSYLSQKKSKLLKNNNNFQITAETAEDQADLESNYPGKETDIVYEWLKEGLQGAEGMPINVQVIGLPWKEEMVLRVMQELQSRATPDLKLQI